MTPDPIALWAWLSKDSRRIVTIDRRETETRITLEWWESNRHRQRVVEQRTLADALAIVIADAEAQGKAT